MTEAGKLESIVRFKTIGERVYRHLLDHILFTSDATTTMVESELTKQLGVSRTPVREALTRLVSEGYIVTAERGYAIPAITDTDVHNMLQLRELLEPVAARQAAEHRGGEGLHEMELAIKAEAKALNKRNVADYVAANARFRQGWVLRVVNPMLLEALSRTMRPYSLLRLRILSDAALREIAARSHIDLLAAFKRGDPQGAHDVQLAAIADIRRALHGSPR